MTVDLGLSPHDVQKRVRAERTVRNGPLTALFEQGRLRLAWQGTELTDYLHAYTSMLIGGLWNDSLALQWGPARRDGERLEIAGSSRRFPFTQRWEVEPVDSSLFWRVWLDATEAFEVQEYHASIVLRRDYARWETDHE